MDDYREKIKDKLEVRWKISKNSLGVPRKAYWLDAVEEEVKKARKHPINSEEGALENIELTVFEERSARESRDPEAWRQKRRISKRNSYIYRDWLAAGYTDEQREKSGIIKTLCERWHISEPDVRQIIIDGKYKRHPSELAADIKALRHQMTVRYLEENEEAVNELKRQIDRIREDPEIEYIPVESRGKVGVIARHRDYHINQLLKQILDLRKSMAEALPGNWVPKPTERQEIEHILRKEVTELSDTELQNIDREIEEIAKQRRLVPPMKEE